MSRATQGMSNAFSIYTRLPSLMKKEPTKRADRGQKLPLCSALSRERTQAIFLCRSVKSESLNKEGTP